MRLLRLPDRYAVCRLRTWPTKPPETSGACYFLARTADEISWVGPQSEIPSEAEHIESDWRALRVAGVLDFSLTGILARLTTLLANANIPVFAVSTHDTDYILVKEQYWLAAIQALEEGGCRMEDTR
ncbi:MAG: ACT domain-containing protein [Rickettsiales bacterium]|nr:ACT domain-containing protein [Rickettsiales bacterium]